MMQRRMRAVLVALFALSVLALPACGSEPDDAQTGPSTAPARAETQSPSPGPATGEEPAVGESPGGPSGGEEARTEGEAEPEKAAPRPVETVRLAAKKTAKARTAKFTMFMDFSGLAPAGTNGPDAFSVRVDGAVDFDRNVSRFTMNMPYIGQMKVRQIGPDVYQKMPEYVRSQLPFEEAWIRWRDDSLATGGSAGQASDARTGTPDDVTGELEYLRGVSDGVEEVGRDWVRGVATTHYRADIDVDVAAEQGSEKLREAFGEVRDELGLTTLPVETWLDDEGRVRRFKMEVPLDTPELRDAGIEDATISLTEEVYDYGAPVRVEAPPEEDTIDVEEIEERSRTRST
ncbi:hypothetical protein GBA65_11350 [Rubrobacter marinus]|uniref:Lipoprotein n=1 Tax=Rubrobacter marinus TaxID=2653852 RepID=A0A6G8PXS9_9ACTN|nr:hypothetical protein [Rubrobacter marinus]QIN79021.1 hypothetical protein GBA65_11350 [Rubrobacter marinus]